MLLVAKMIIFLPFVSGVFNGIFCKKMTPSFFLFFSPKFGAPVTYIQVVENDVVSLGIFILRQAVAG